MKTQKFVKITKVHAIIYIKPYVEKAQESVTFRVRYWEIKNFEKIRFWEKDENEKSLHRYRK